MYCYLGDGATGRHEVQTKTKEKKDSVYKTETREIISNMLTLLGSVGYDPTLFYASNVRLHACSRGS